MKEEKEIKGIGGWLVLPTIGFIVAAVIYIYIILYLLTLIPEIVNWSMFGIMFVSYTALSFTMMNTLILEFRKKGEFRDWAIASLWLPIFLGFIIDVAIGTYGVEAAIGDVIFYSIPSALWTLYFVKSKRVKNTFVN